MERILDTPEEPEESKDLSQGYCVELYVNADGTYGVGEPEPLAEEQAEGEATPEAIPDLTAALKKLLNVVKSNPIGTDGQAQFDAGYSGKPMR